MYLYLLAMLFLAWPAQAQIFGEPWDHLIESTCAAPTDMPLACQVVPMSRSTLHTWYRTSRNSANGGWFPTAHANTWVNTNNTDPQYSPGSPAVSSTWTGVDSFPYFSESTGSGGDQIQSVTPSGTPGCGEGQPDCIITLSATQVGSYKQGNLAGGPCGPVAPYQSAKQGFGIPMWETADIVDGGGSYSVGNWTGRVYIGSWLTPSGCSSSGLVSYTRYMRDSAASFPFWRETGGTIYGPTMVPVDVIVSENYSCDTGCLSSMTADQIISSANHMERFYWVANLRAAGGSPAIIGKWAWEQFETPAVWACNQGDPGCSYVSWAGVWAKDGHFAGRDVQQDCSVLITNGYFWMVPGNGNPNMTWDTCWEWSEFHQFVDGVPQEQFSIYPPNDWPWQN